MIFKKKLLTNLFIFILMIFLVINSRIVITSVSTSINIFLEKILPSLFIYIFITEILINSGAIYELSIGISKVLSKLFKIPENTTSTVIIGFLMGYPNSAKYILKLYNDGKITNTTATKLVSFTSNANMAYIVGTIGITMFHNISYGVILVTSHFLSSIIIGVFIKVPNSSIIIHQTKIKENSFKKIYSYFDVLTISILGTLKTLGIILSFTVIFSLIPVILLNYINLPDYLSAIITGIFEISNGISQISILNISINYRLTIISFIVSFSSLMVLMQIYSFVYKANVKFKDLIKYKLLQGIISSIITYILLLILPVKSTLVYSDYYEVTKKLLILPSTIYMFLIFFTIVVCNIIYRKKRQ